MGFFLRKWDMENFIEDSLVANKVSLSELLGTVASQNTLAPALTALRDSTPGGESINWTRSDLSKNVQLTGRFLKAKGITGQSKIALLLPNIPEYHLFLWGGMSVCGVAPINPLLRPEYIVEILKELDADLLICPSENLDSGLWKRAQDVAKAIDGLEILEVGPNTEFSQCLDKNTDDNSALEPRSLQSYAAHFHTGGTTGKPKIISLSLGNVLHVIKMLQSTLKFTSTDTFVCPLPLFHIAGAVIGGIAPLLSGTHVVMPSAGGLRDPDVLKNFWKILAHYKASIFVAVPTSLSALMTVPLDGADISSLDYILTGTAPLPLETARSFSRFTGKPLYPGYGMTEASGGVTFIPRGSIPKEDSVGLPLPSLELKIVNPKTKEMMPTGSVGNVLIKGPNVFNNILDDVGKIDQNWFDTGDMGRLDKDGWLTLTGRSKDLIIRGGHNIDPCTIEETAAEFEGISLVAAVGQVDDYAGEVPVLYIQLKSQNKNTFSLAEFEKFLNNSIAEPPARPKSIFIIDEMPLTAVGKIFKPALRADAAKRRLNLLKEKFDFLPDEDWINVETGKDGRLIVSLSSSSLSNDQIDILKKMILSYPVELQLI